MSFLPKKVGKPQVPPIKCQGIKTDLVDFIGINSKWNGSGTWIEPFLGSGVVLFNIQPEKALVSDANKYIIRFYRKIQNGDINGKVVRDYLEKHGSKLKEKGEDYYYKMRDEFNEDGSVLKLLFLNRSCYNGMMRFNLSGEYNVPFCRKPERFRKAYVTKIVNQVNAVAEIMKDKDWEFKEWEWEKTIEESDEEDFIYCDPPYVGRHTGYVGKWEKEDAEKLAKVTQDSKAGFALSMWKKNKYRENSHIEKCWEDCVVRTQSHFYYVGSTEDLRNEMEEALVIKKGSQASEDKVKKLAEKKEQMEISEVQS